MIQKIFFFPKLLSFYMTACKKNSTANKTGKNVFSALCEQTDFIYVTVIFRIVNRRISILCWHDDSLGLY